MGKLVKKQNKFTRAYPILMLYAQYLGYEISDGDAYRDERCHYGHPNSTHRSRLARDFILRKDGVLLSGAAAAAAHNKLHDFWDMLGGSKRIARDLNHYSFKHNGVR